MEIAESIFKFILASLNVCALAFTLILVSKWHIRMENKLDEPRLRCREGWHKRDRAFRPQSFRKRTTWHRIRSRCF